jgi:signal peptidase I
MEPTQTQPVVIKKKEFSFFKELFIFACIAVCIVLPFRMFIAEPYIVSGTSMSPTFETGHYLIVDKISYRFQNPKRFDVVVMKYPADTSRDFIKRIIGLPGDTLTISHGKVRIVNTENPKGFDVDDSYVVFPKDDTLTKTLDSNEYFVMGDNRAGSFDSRYWGALPKEDIIGRPILRLFPVSDIGFVPGTQK